MKIGDVVRGKTGTLLKGYRGTVTGFSGGDPSEFVFVNWIGKAYSDSLLTTINPSCLEVEEPPYPKCAACRLGVAPEQLYVCRDGTIVHTHCHTGRTGT